MSGYIFSRLIENIYESTNIIKNFDDEKDKYLSNIYKTINDIPNNNVLFYFFIILFIYAIFKNIDIRLNNIFILLVSLIIIYILIQKDSSSFYNFIDKNNDKLKFLNSFLSQSNIEKGTYASLLSIRSKKRVFSYLYYDSYIVEVMYNLKEYINFNVSSYSDCIKCINTILMISFMSDQLKYNLVDNFHSMIRQKNEALNSLSTIIYCLPVEYRTYNKFKSSIKTLHILLNSHISKVAQIFKNKVREDRNNYTPLDVFEISDFVAPNDMKTMNYNSTYDLY